MKSFKDARDREWSFAINVATMKRVRDRLGVNLYTLVDGGFEGLAALLGDPIALVDVLFVLCQDQAEKDHVSDEDFGRAMAGDAILRASDAFLAELTDFFPQPRVRAGLTKVMVMARVMSDRMMDRAEAALEAIDLEAEVAKLNGSSGSSPAASASTPDRSPSENLT